MIICNRTGGGRVAFADKKAAFAYINEYQKEKYDRITKTNITTLVEKR